MIAANTQLAPPPARPPAAATPPTDTLRVTKPAPGTPPREYASNIVSQIRQRHQDACHAKLQYFGDWYLNLAFYCGRQWCNWDRGGKFLRDLANPINEIRHTANRIRPICDSVMALLASGKPQIEVVPATSELEDEQSAAVSTAMLEYTNEVTHWNDLKKDRDGFRILYGTAAIRYGINPEPVRVLNVPVPNPLTGVPMMRQIPEYELEGFCYSPFHFHTFPIRMASYRDIRGVMFDKYMPVEEAREKWPTDAVGEPITIEPAPDIGTNEQRLLQMEGLFGPTAFSNSDPGKALRGMTRVFEYLELPTKTYPAGCKKTVCNQHLVESFDNPYVGLFPPEAANFLKLGVVFYRGLQVPGRPLGVGIPEDLRPLQVRHNSMITAQERNRKACGLNRYIIDAQTIDKKQITDEHGTIIDYRSRSGGQGVQVIPALNLDFGPQIAQNGQDMDDIGRRPPITRGRNESQVRSAQQQSMLAASADVVFSLMAEDTEQGDANVARLKLALMKRYYNGPKIGRIVGQQKGYAASVIAAAEMYTDVRVVEGSGLPKNREAWNQMVADYWKMGAIVDQNGMPDFSWLRQNLNLGGATMEDRFTVDRDHADSENVVMAQSGQPLPVQPWNNNAVEMERHELYLKKNPRLAPPAQQAIFLHLQAHAQQLMMQGMGQQPQQGQPQQPQAAGGPQ